MFTQFASGGAMIGTPGGIIGNRAGLISSGGGGLPTATFTESFENGTYDNAGWTPTGNVTNGTSPAGGFTGGGTKSNHQANAGVATYIYYTKGSNSNDGVMRIGLYITTLPTDFTSLLLIQDQSDNVVLDIYMAGGTTATLRGATNANITLAGSAWSDLEIKINKNATSYVRVNGAGEQTFTGANNGFCQVKLGAITYHTDGVFDFDFIQWNNTATAYIGP